MAKQTCPTCGGRGAVSNAQSGSPELCPNCQGQGSVSVGTDDLVFWYLFLAPGTNLPPVLGGGAVNVPAQVVIDNDSDFLCDRIIASSTGLYSLFATDNFSSRPFTPNQNVPVNGENMAGTAQLPFWLPKPYLFRRTSTIKGLFNDRSGESNTIQFAFVGYKVS